MAGRPNAHADLADTSKQRAQQHRRRARRAGTLLLTELSGPRLEALEYECLASHSLTTARLVDRADGTVKGRLFFCTRCGAYASTVQTTRPRPIRLKELCRRKPPTQAAVRSLGRIAAGKFPHQTSQPGLAVTTQQQALWQDAHAILGFAADGG